MFNTKEQILIAQMELTAAQSFFDNCQPDLNNIAVQNLNLKKEWLNYLYKKAKMEDIT